MSFGSTQVNGILVARVITADEGFLPGLLFVHYAIESARRPFFQCLSLQPLGHSRKNFIRKLPAQSPRHRTAQEKTITLAQEGNPPGLDREIDVLWSLLLKRKCAFFLCSSR
jgi:hypothetical protein